MMNKFHLDYFHHILVLFYHDKTGLICDGNNLDEIYSSLNSMIVNKKYLHFGKNAKELSSKFDWSNTIEQYKKILT